MADKKLTKQQRAFLDDHYMHPEEPQYVVYMRHYKSNETAARANSARLLSSPQAQEYLEDKQAEARERMNIEVDEIIQAFWNLANFDLADIYTNNWEVKPIQDIPDHARRAITSITPMAGRTYRITFASRIAALQHVAKMLGYDEKAGENTEASLFKQLFNRIQENSLTGRPGTLKFDPEIAKHSQFDA